MEKFSPKDPVEKVIVTFDFSNLLISASEQILDTTWEVHVYQGSDTTPSAMLTNESTTNTGTTASHMISGGISGNTYLISCIVNTNVQQRLKSSALMQVISQG